MAQRMKRHGRREIRSSLTGPQLSDPLGRVMRFELDARSALALLQQSLPAEMRNVTVRFATAPSAEVLAEPITGNPYYAIDPVNGSIVLYRMPIQRAKVLHVDDAEHRRLFTGHCLYRAVCELLGRDPWDLLPGYFDHY